MTIWCKHVHRLELQTFFNFCAAHLPVRLDIETKFPYFLFLTWLSIIRNSYCTILPAALIPYTPVTSCSLSADAIEPICFTPYSATTFWGAETVVHPASSILYLSWLSNLFKSITFPRLSWNLPTVSRLNCKWCCFGCFYSMIVPFFIS